ncbi:MAG: hypothetical protein M3S32_10160, partial [Acidobacteriota bacterium]|nr:hypothetical protein [Acidobacteriota bacterium]
MRMKIRAFCLVGCALAAGILSAQTPVPAPAPEAAKKPPPLFANLGDYHRPISSRSPDAQRYFDQGLRLVYGFNHEEAFRAFEHAASVDPGCGICSWGMALVQGPNINLPAIPERAAAGYAAEQGALERAASASPVERALIEALSKRYAKSSPTDPKAQKALDAAYANAMRRVAARFPSDPDVATLFAESLMDLRPWDLWTHSGAPQPGTREILSQLERVLARHPSHPGANHYYVHAIEASPRPDRALASARRLESMMPGAGHLVHMPAHIYMRTGRYEEAAAANRRAILSDARYTEEAGPRDIYQMYVAHNHQFLWAAAMMEGRSAEALEAARNTVAAAPVEMLRAMPGFDILLTYPVLTLARFGRWEATLLEPAPPSDFPFAGAMWHYARGIAFASTDRLEEAAAENRELERLAAPIPADARESLNSAAALLGIARRVLSARIAARQGRTEDAIRDLTAAASEEDGLSYAEPADWHSPVRQALGALLLARGDAGRAERVYREDLRRNPENGWALFGLAR